MAFGSFSSPYTSSSDTMVGTQTPQKLVRGYPGGERADTGNGDAADHGGDAE